MHYAHPMSTQLTIRLPEDLRTALDTVAARTQRSSSQVVRLALEAYLGTGDTRGRKPVDRVRNLIGSLESGVSDLAEHHREYVLESLESGR